MMSADQKRGELEKKVFLVSASGGPPELAVAVIDRFTLTCGIEGFKGGEESVCTHHHRVTVNREE